MSEKTTREELAENIDEAEWQWLKPHLERGALITVAAAIDLEEAGEKIATDDAAVVTDWIRAGRLGKPTEEQTARWDDEPTKKFLALIVSPYVLIQEIGTMN